jgi:hypothetical protein
MVGLFIAYNKLYRNAKLVQVKGHKRGCIMSFSQLATRNVKKSTRELQKCQKAT